GCPFEKTKKTHKRETSEIHFPDKDKWFLITVDPFFDEKKDLTGAVHMARDITASKKIEDQLRQAQKMESIGTLAGGIAHEFNNILGIIIGNTELALMDVPDWNPVKECLEETRKASIRAKDVVRQITSFARKTPLGKKPIQIGTIIKESLKLIRATTPAIIEIRQTISCESEMILAQPTEISQVFMNLCSNSAHAIGEEAGVLEVNLENEELRMKNEELGLEAGRYVKLTVRDTGSGIKPEIIDRIFDPYFTTKDVDEGLGMGLAVVYGIVKKHDGAIKVKSEVDKGTVVEVLFPIIKAEVEGEVEEPETLRGDTGRILFVDDEASLAKMTEQMLVRLGYEVVTKTNPKEALALFKAEPDRFDLVITDMAMPYMTGVKLAEELMAIRQDIAVILCTGHSDRIDEVKALRLGFKAYATKPLVMENLANLVRKVLDHK
ncbi:MAG: response regulator, partial [Deltaproteobacteria bacterium]|nr:response regulator [Deltaproteobacteria bacterium]